MILREWALLTMCKTTCHTAGRLRFVKSTPQNKAPCEAPRSEELLGLSSVVAQDEGQTVISTAHNDNLGVVAFCNFLGGLDAFPLEEFVA